MGAVSPHGIGTASLMDAIYGGRSAVVSRRVEWSEQVHDLTCWVAAPLVEPLDLRSVPRSVRRSMGRVALSQMAAVEAKDQAGLSQDDLRSGRTGVSLGSTLGSTASLSRFFDAYYRHEIGGLPGSIFFQFMSHTCAANVAHALGITGEVVSPNAACASSLQAIGHAFESIRRGDQDIVLCGGAEELHVLASASFDLMGAASTHFNDQPSRTPRPFDRDRDGTVCGEGAGVVVLESRESSLARGSRALAEIEVYANTTDSSHIAQPHGDSIKACLRKALDQAELVPENVDYLSAHATGTVWGDRAEAEAVCDVFGECRVPVSGFKGYIGHTLGGSGALELIVCLNMMAKGCIVPTLNLDVPGEGCEGLDHVMSLRQVRFNRFFKSSFALGGVNTVLGLRGCVDGESGDC